MSQQVEISYDIISKHVSHCGGCRSNLKKKVNRKNTLHQLDKLLFTSSLRYTSITSPTHLQSLYCYLFIRVFYSFHIILNSFLCTFICSICILSCATRSFLFVWHIQKSETDRRFSVPLHITDCFPQVDQLIKTKFCILCLRPGVH